MPVGSESSFIRPTITRANENDKKHHEDEAAQCLLEQQLALVQQTLQLQDSHTLRLQGGGSAAILKSALGAKVVVVPHVDNEAKVKDVCLAAFSRTCWPRREVTNALAFEISTLTNRNIAILCDHAIDKIVIGVMTKRDRLR